MDFTAIKKLLGTEDEITEDNLHDILKAHMDTTGKKVATMKKSHEETVGKLTAMSHKVAELEKGEPKIDPDTLDLMSDAVDAKAETLVAASRITPGVRDKLLPFLRGMPDARPVLMLSRKRAGTEKAPAIHILEVLAENDVVKLGEQTNAQVTAMSRQTPDEKETGFDEATHKEMRDMVGVTG